MDNYTYMEPLYLQWKQDPQSVAPQWAAYFQKLEAPDTPRDAPIITNAGDLQPYQKIEQSRVDRLLWAYRDIGYLYSRLNPLGDQSVDHSYLRHDVEGEFEKLTLEEFGIPPEDLDLVFFAGRSMQPSTAKLRTIIEAFQSTYCSSIGVEFLHIQNKKVRRWLIEAMESTQNKAVLSLEKRRTIIADLIRTEELEHFLDSFFIGQKRFSIEGCEALIAALHFLVDEAQGRGIDTVTIGTTHRGRLSVLTTILNMSPEELFSRFDENFKPDMYQGGGDVKYHLGYHTVHVNPDGTAVRIELSSNPSHLESVDAVAEGKTRAFQDEAEDNGQKRVAPVLIHGDAAFCGQGVVSETFNLSRLQGFTTGGTIHIIINNQIGFTTPSRNARSTLFPTDAAKMLPVPIFHVNGDDPEAIVYLIDLALRFRQTFGLDCIIDIFCYRRHGHNEGDEPSFTHPYMYRIIREHQSVTSLYGEMCTRQEIMSRQEQDQIRRDYHRLLKSSLDKSRSDPVPTVDDSQGKAWGAIEQGYSWEPVKTAVDDETLQRIAAHITAVPEGFTIHPKLGQIIETKARLFAEKKQVDWSFAESLAFGSLLLEGVAVRLSGQDCERGTFSQRHLTWWDNASATPNAYTPLSTLGASQARFMAFDSPLSEYSVLGFEYGYSLVNPRKLVLWEAQFGDFSNGAQVIFDNFISCGESKWRRSSGLVMLLPHGNEGQGPDHSNAHLERFLHMCAEENMHVCNLTTPAQYFHALRRQIVARYRKPLIIMAPKSLLRHPLVVSYLSDLTGKGFEAVLDDPWKIENVGRLILCSGKIYYDLYAHREKTARTDVAIVRIEQLYPFPSELIGQVLLRYAHAKSVLWVQEEHKNFGAWYFIRERFASVFPDIKLVYTGRPESASPATGRLKQHRAEQQKVVENAFA